MGEYEILDTDEPLPGRIARHAFDRLIMLSDGVFAIAITLLALEIRPPEGLPPGGEGLFAALAPALVGFVISFMVVSAYWIAHRRIFARLRRVDGWTTVLTLVLLGFVVLQPVSLEMLLHFHSRGEALVLYVALIGVIGLAQTALWGYVAFIARLVDPSLSTSYRVAQLIGGFVTPLAACSLSIYAATHASTPGYVAFALFLLVVVARQYAARRFAS
jgi:uncharacterized membrane protein